MEKHATVLSLRDALGRCEKSEGGVGFVPTMGALHQGHLSLVDMCKSMCKVVVVSVFVNPTQFNDKGDLERYPRTPEADLKMLESAGCDFVFMPSVEEIYPEEDKRIFDFGMLDKTMEGAFRPGHFNGVAQVVSRLFDIVTPDKAFFGQKDFQQVAVIKNMVAQLRYNVEIVVAPIIRESDGLAMSSRNVLLNAGQRKSAAGISQALFAAQSEAGKIPINILKTKIISTIDSDPELKTEYLEIVDSTTLQSVEEWDDAPEIFACVAVKVGKIRLIDNVKLMM
ncbi:MAG: pantoate--beta-alanine ligase [Prevotellaceae bacterium]|jgi:pantoate--beta-alanine ligase|nr:pantoate--beta-alanine ligase [Prevotellaceae bacterium]